MRRSTTIASSLLATGVAAWVLWVAIPKNSMTPAKAEIIEFKLADPSTAALDALAERFRAAALENQRRLLAAQGVDEPLGERRLHAEEGIAAIERARPDGGAVADLLFRREAKK